MSLITRNNYEAYLLDYIDENLSPELIAELMLFLENNPDLKEELDSFEIHQLEPDSTVFLPKEELKKDKGEIILLNYEDFFINEIEGLNSSKDSKKVLLFINRYPQKQKEFEVYQKTRLVAPSILFEDKKSLKKKERKVIPLYWWYSSAAAIILILLLFRGLNNNDAKESNMMANEIEEVVPEAIKDIVVDKNDVVEEEIEKVDVADVSPKKENKTVKKVNQNKDVPKVIIPEEKPDNDLADNKIDIEAPKDSIVNKIELKLQEEELLIADNVTITYEDEEEKEQVKKERITRFKLIKEILNQRVKKKIFQQEKNNDGVVTAYAVDVSGVGFTRKRRKNRK